MSSKKNAQRPKKSGKAKNRKKLSSGDRNGQYERKVKMPSFAPAALPAAMGGVVTTGQPRLRSEGKSVIVSHTEYCQPLVTVTDDEFESIVTYMHQPASLDNFHWLSYQAMGYELYRWISLSFFFRSTVGTSSAGTLMVVTQQDENDPVPASSFELLNYAGAQSCNLWQSMTHDCLLRRNDYMKKYFTLPDGTTPTAGQIYTPGKTSFIAINEASPAKAYDVYVTYTVELFSPKQIPSIMSVVPWSDVTVGGNPNVPAITGGTTNAWPDVQMPVISIISGTPGTVGLTFPVNGYYQLLANGALSAVNAAFDFGVASLSSAMDVALNSGLSSVTGSSSLCNNLFALYAAAANAYARFDYGLNSTTAMSGLLQYGPATPLLTNGPLWLVSDRKRLSRYKNAVYVGSHDGGDFDRELVRKLTAEHRQYKPQEKKEEVSKGWSLLGR